MSTIVTRAGKGSALTHNEVDANFVNLNTDKIQSGNTVGSLVILSATISGGSVTGITDLAVVDGGTGASDASTARTNLSAQETLVSGTNIKTINSSSILGSGNLDVSVSDGDKGDITVSASGATWTIDSGAVTPDKLSTQSQYTGFKNRIINGAMVIDQRNAGASVTASTINTVVYTLDRWAYYCSQASKFTVQKNAASVTPPVGFSNYLGVTSSATTSVGSGDYFFIRQSIEGFNFADIAYGTANAQTITFSFWVRSSLTGTFGGSLQNNTANRSYPFTYTINSANTWEQKSVTIAGDTSGTWVGATNGIGASINFSLGAGTTFSGTAGAWAASNLISATGATSVVGTSGATFYITGVQLEKGTQATSFDYRPYGTELALCQRYCPAWGVTTANQNFPGAGQAYLTTAAIVLLPYQVKPRVAATGITVTGSIALLNSAYGATGAATVAIYAAGTSIDTLAINLTGVTGLVAGNATSMIGSGGAAKIIGNGCEL